MIEAYKILNGNEQIDSGQFLRLAENHYCMRGHERKLTKERSRLDVSQEAFFQSKNNQLMEQPASQSSQCKTVNGFKNEYDQNYPNDNDDRSR